MIAAVVVSSMILCGLAAAEPSLNGFTGLLATPTADALDDGAYNLGLNSSEVEDWDDFSYYANFGLGDETEVGVLLFRTDEDNINTSVAPQSVRGRRDETFLHIKRALAEEDGGPRIAAGIFDLSDEIETTVYVVGSWEQGRVVGQIEGREVRFVNLHAGFAAGLWDDFFAGAQLLFGPDVQVMGEFVEDDFNLGARFSPAPSFNVDFGFMDVEDLAINVSYNRDF